MKNTWGKTKNWKSSGAGLLVVGILTAGLAGCASKQILPTSLNASLMTSLDAERTQFEASGRGEEYEIAVADAEKVAIAKALQDLLQTPEERSSFSFVEKSLYMQHAQYVEGSELKDRRREPDGSVRVKMHVIVNKRSLEQYLVSQGVIKEREAIIEELRNPSIAVLVANKDEKADWAQFAINHASSYLTGRKFQVLDLQQVNALEEMNEVVRELDGADQDSMAAVALQIGSDIYLEVEAKIEGGNVGSSGTIKASASVKTFETTTARQLGAASGFSQNYAATSGSRNKALAEALSDAVDRVLTNTMDYWKSDIKKGNQFLVNIRGNFAGADGQQARRIVHKALQSATSDMKQTLATDKTLNYRVWSKTEGTDLLFALQEKVADELGKNLRSVVENRKLLVLDLE